MGEDRTSIISKAVNLKKAGMPTAATIVILVLSTPGFYEFFFNKTDDKAMAKAEVAYEVLKERSEAQSRELTMLRTELGQLRMFLMTDSYAMEGAVESEMEPPPPEPIGIGIDVGEGGPVDLVPPDELFVGGSGMFHVEQQVQEALPESLDHESLVDRINAKVSKK